RVFLLELGEVDQAFRIAGIGFVAGDIGGQAVGIAALPVASARMAAAAPSIAVGTIAALLRGLAFAAFVAGRVIGFGSRGGRAGVFALYGVFGIGHGISLIGARSAGGYEREEGRAKIPPAGRQSSIAQGSHTSGTLQDSAGSPEAATNCNGSCEAVHGRP